jgi:hypothetical protein
MEMMDLRTYLDSIREGYDRAFEDLYDRVRTVSEAMAGVTQAYAPSRVPGTGAHEEMERPRRRHRHDDCCDCGCHEHDCRCECCIVDADVVVYARCGELRVVPIEIENDTRKAREDVKLSVGKPHSSGGRELPWPVLLSPSGAVTLAPCSTTKVELLVMVRCGKPGGDDPKKDVVRPAKEGAARATVKDKPVEVLTNVLDVVSRERLTTGDVDRCEVGYVTVQAEGCLVRPIVVAIAVLPDDCGRYHAERSCSCCC